MSEQLNPLCPTCEQELTECKVFESGQSTFVSAIPRQWTCEPCKRSWEDEDLDKTVYVFFMKDCNGLLTGKAHRETVYESRRAEHFAGVDEHYYDEPEAYPIVVPEHIIPPKPEKPWLIRIMEDEFRQNAEVTYPEMTDDQWSEFVDEIGDNYDYSRVFDDLAGYLDHYMERQDE